MNSKLENFIKIVKSEAIDTQKNGVKVNKYTLDQDLLSWDGAFIDWCAKEAGIDLPSFSDVDEAYLRHKKSGTLLTIKNKGVEPQQGDIVFFNFKKEGNIHVGVCINNIGNGIIYTVEGNTSLDSKGLQSKGKSIAKKVRGWNKKNYKKLECDVIGWVNSGLRDAEPSLTESVIDDKIKKPVKKTGKKTNRSVNPKNTSSRQLRAE